MKKITKIALLIIVLVGMLFVLSGCGKKEETKYTSKPKNETSETNTANKNQTAEENAEDSIYNVDFAQAAEKQMSMPEDGEEIAIIHIKEYGDVKVKFFPEVAPKAVENFVTHSKNGYYNNGSFHRIIEDFMIQGGDPLGTGYGGESIWGEGFGTELDYKLFPYKGALCMAMSSQPNSIGSQFFIEQQNPSEFMATQMKTSGYPDGLVEAYTKYGGSPHIYLQYTVFGQVFEGIDIVDKIAKETKVEDDNGTVLKENQPIIESIEITTYKK